MQHDEDFIYQEEAKEIDKIRHEPKVSRALAETKNASVEPDHPSNKFNKVAFISVMVFGAAAVLNFLMKSDLIFLADRYRMPLGKILLCIMAAAAVLFVNALLQGVFIRKIDDQVRKYNAGRVSKLAAASLIAVACLTILFTNWYGALVSFGVISLIVGIALQNPITSFFGWLYILVRKPYEIGDRVKIGGATGDVIELNYFDTTLWEFGGDYLSGDHPSGRIIRFPNSKVFSEFIFNYSWPLFPYIWDEMKFYVAYESDLRFISDSVHTLIKTEIGDQMSRRIQRYRLLLDETPVKELQVRENGSVSFRASDNTWIEVVVRFLVEPKQAGAVKNRLFLKIFEALNDQKEKVHFPKTNMR